MCAGETQVQEGLRLQLRLATYLASGNDDRFTSVAAFAEGFACRIDPQVLFPLFKAKY